MAGAFESEALEKAQRRRVFGVDPGDHDMLAEREGAGQEGIQQVGSDALSAKTGMDVNGAFDGKAISRPGAEITERCKSRNLSAVSRNQDREALRGAAAPPRNPLLNG